MYQMSPDMPRQLYAELLQSREHDRIARRAAGRLGSPTPSVQRRTARQGFARKIRHTRFLTQFARG